MPIVRTMPAMPGSVSVAWMADSAPSISTMFISNAATANTPNKPYETIMYPMTAISPTIDAILPASIESAPRPGPIDRSSSTISGAGNAPARKIKASSFVSATEKLPVIWPEPKI